MRKIGLMAGMAQAAATLLASSSPAVYPRTQPRREGKKQYQPIPVAEYPDKGKVREGKRHRLKGVRP